MEITGDNCQGNGYWTPPNGNWWEWYSAIGQSAWHNSGSFDYAGGATYAYNPVSISYNYDGYYLAADEIGGGEYLPKRRVSAPSGSASFKVAATGLDPGDTFKVKVGFRNYSGLLDVPFEVV